MTWPCLGLEGWYDTYLIEDLALLWSWGLRTWPSLGFEGWELGLALDLRVEDLALPWSWGLRTWPWLRHLRWWWGGWWLIDWLIDWLVGWSIDEGVDQNNDESWRRGPGLKRTNLHAFTPHVCYWCNCSSVLWRAAPTRHSSQTWQEASTALQLPPRRYYHR